MPSIAENTVSQAPATASPASQWSARRLNALAAAAQARTYLEIGVYLGDTFLAVDVEERTAVDPDFRFDPLPYASAQTFFRPTTSDIFFATLPVEQTFDLVFIDGLHTFEQSYRDVCNSLLHSHAGTLILIDDTKPNDVYSTLESQERTLKFRSAVGNRDISWHGDTFKLVFALHDFHFGLNYRTIVGSGNPQTLAWRSRQGGRTPRFNSFESISRLGYFDLIDHLDILRECSEVEAIALCLTEIGAPGKAASV